MRYEIRDINPPANVRAAMELQAEAERRKRAQVSLSLGLISCRIPAKLFVPEQINGQG